MTIEHLYLGLSAKAPKGLHNIMKLFWDTPEFMAWAAKHWQDTIPRL